MYRRLAAITGMPRSGTSWIGQIVDSCPQVRFKMSPLFSYEFKNRIRKGATAAQWQELLQAAYVSENEFLNQTHRRALGEYPTFADKLAEPPLMVIKFNRYHNLIEEMLDLLPDLKMLAVIRHPCGTIHSWLTAPKEFPQNVDPWLHWRSGAIKKTEYGDFFGFDDWCSVTRLHLRLSRAMPERFRCIRYEDYVIDPQQQTHELFAWLDLELTRQTEDFLQRSHATPVPGVYSVFKDPGVKDRWKKELDPRIRKAIFDELTGSDLEDFLG